MLLAGVLLSLPLLLLIYRAPAPQGPVAIQRLCSPDQAQLVGREVDVSGTLVQASPLLIADPTQRGCVARVELRSGASALSMFPKGAWVYVRATYRGTEAAEGGARARLDEGDLIQASQSSPSKR